MTQIIDGKQISKELKDELKEKVTAYRAQGIEITLAVIQVGNDKASSVYVGNKKKACEYIGIHSLSYELEEHTTEDELLDLIRRLNGDDKVNGILVQLPLPKHINEDKVIETIDAKKDVDGFHPMSVGALSIGKKGFISCTPYGIIELLKRSGTDIEGKECVVIGRSNIVGKPMSMLLLREERVEQLIKNKIEEIGYELYDVEYVKEGAIVIDVGIHRDENNKLCGDVDYEDVFPHVSAITPVPGGVGPMTIAMLMKNCVNAVEIQK